MEPAYMNMQSYPNQKDHIYYGSPYCPGMEAAPTQMYVNPDRPPMGYGYWPWGSNCGGASPIGCHGCCNHSYLPVHCAWGSPYSHVQPHHCPGNYPYLPLQYMPPPPYHAMEQPRYDYEKNRPREHHCCRCLSHPLHQKEQRNVRIEEEEPERERRKDDSVIPFQSKNSPYPFVWLPPDYDGNKAGEGKYDSRVSKVHEKDSSYPIVWLPPDYISNKEQGKVTSSGDKKDGSRDVKAHENGKVMGQQPAFWNGWLPFDLNNLVSTKNKGDEEENNQLDNGKRNSPFPLFWMPYKPEVKDGEKHKVKDSNTTPSSESEMGSGGEQSFHVSRENICEQAVSRVRDIPVKEGGQQVFMETPIKQEKERDTSVKDRRDNDVGDKASSQKEGPKGKSSSPSKSSKLPPVCLRVDPLPRRKNRNGSSRSPSPPGGKQKPDSQSNDASKVLNSSENKEQDKILHNGLKKDNTENVEAVDGRTLQGKDTDVKMATPVKLPAIPQDDVLENQSEEKASVEHIAQKHIANDSVIDGQSEDDGSAGRENEGSLRAQEMKVDEVKNSCRRELSEEEAAVMIQSAYRGFDVRRWEPIKKLKQIAKVREQIADVKHLMQAMKSATDTQGRKKQRNIVAESIMSLLLKLDIIQGLHPSVREVRKSVVRELVSLQEQLDSLMYEEPENSPGEEPMVTCDDALNKIEDVISSQSDDETTPTYLLEAQKNQIDGGSKHENSGISEVNLIGEASEKIEKEAVVSSTYNIVDSAPEPTVKEEGKGHETTLSDWQAHQNQIGGGRKHDRSLVLEADQVVEEVSHEIEKEVPESSMNEDVESASEPTIEKDEISSEVPESDDSFSREVCNDLVLGQGSEVLSLQDNSSAEAADIAATDSNAAGSDLIELPVGVLDEFFGQEGPSDVTIEADASKANQVKQLEESFVESPIISEPHETTDDEDGNRTCGTHKVLDVAFNGVDVEPETVDSCSTDDKLGSEEEVDSKTGDARIEPVECIAQQLRNLIGESDEARDMIRVEGAAEAKYDDNGNDSDNCTTQQCVITENSSGKQMQPQITGDSEKNTEEPADLPQQGEEFNDSGEVSVQNQPLIILDSRTHVEESVDVPQQGDSPQQGAEFNESGEVSEEKKSQKTVDPQTGFGESVEDALQQGEECHKELKEALEEQGLMDASAHEENAVDTTSFEDSLARNELTQKNKKLVEENERLREMMEKMLKSGEEQLAAISILSGRVKDLEKKLARKKKLKVRQYTAPRSGSSCMTKFDGMDNRERLGWQCRRVV